MTWRRIPQEYSSILVKLGLAYYKNTDSKKPYDTAWRSFRRQRIDYEEEEKNSKTMFGEEMGHGTWAAGCLLQVKVSCG